MMFKPGDWVECIDPRDCLRIGRKYLVTKTWSSPNQTPMCTVEGLDGKFGQYRFAFFRNAASPDTKPTTFFQGIKTMFNDMKNSAVAFIKEHRTLIYGIAVVFLLDEFVFKGKFRERLSGLVEKVISKIEEKIS